jgi:hypothetical protein
MHEKIPSKHSASEQVFKLITEFDEKLIEKVNLQQENVTYFKN